MVIKILTRLVYKVAAQINKNNAGELSALQDYSELNALLTSAIDETDDEDLKNIFQEGIGICREVSSDEHNHSLKWSAYTKKLDGIAPASDGLATAVKYLLNGS